MALPGVSPLFIIKDDRTIAIEIDGGTVSIDVETKDVKLTGYEPGRKATQLLDILRRASAISITRRSGFKATYPNMVTVSVIFGGGTYSDNHDNLEPEIDFMLKHGVYPLGQSSSAEIAMWTEAPRHMWLANYYKPDNGDIVVGWQTPAEVLHALQWAERFDTSTITPEELAALEKEEEERREAFRKFAEAANKRNDEKGYLTLPPSE